MSSSSARHHVAPRSPLAWARRIGRHAALVVAGGITASAATHAGTAGRPVGVPHFDHCFDIHGKAYGVSPDLLRALARTESSMNPHAINAAHQEQTGSIDIGLLQINSRWLPKLQRFGIERAQLHDACTNIEVGAWILSDLIRSKGNSWDAVGAWNAACTQLRGEDCRAARARFAWKVYDRLQPTATFQPTQANRPPVVSGLVRTSDLAAVAAADEVTP